MTITADIKAQAVGDLVLGMSARQVGRKYGVDEKSVRNWRDRYLPEPQNSAISAQNTVDVGALIADYIAEGITTLAAQARHCRDPDWLAR